MQQRRIATLLAILVVIALVSAGCGRNRNPETPTPEATIAPTEAPAEPTAEPTEAPAEAPTDAPAPEPTEPPAEEAETPVDQVESPLAEPEQPDSPLAQPDSPLDSPLPGPQGLNADTEAILAAGAELLAIGEYEQALALYDEAIAADSNQALLYSGRGDVNFETKRFLEADADYTDALALAQTPTLLAKQCRMNITLQKENAIDDCNRALEMDPASVDAHLALASYYRGLGEYEPARASLESALAITETGEVLYQLAMIDLAEEKWDDALSHLSAAIELDPQPEYYWERAMYYLAGTETEKSLADLETLRKVSIPQKHGGLLFRAASQIRMLTGEYPSD